MSRARDPGLGAGGVIFEIRVIGEIQRVAAVDAASGVEVVIQAPANAPRVDVEALALRKLARALEARSAPNPGPGEKQRGKLA